MYSNIHTVIQLFIIGGWITILLYSYFRKWKYIGRIQRVLLLTSCLGFTVLNTAMYDSTIIETDWFSILLYTTQASFQVLLVLNFKERELKTDKLKTLEISLDTFTKMSHEAHNAQWAMGYESKIIRYSNPAYQKMYGESDGQDLTLFWDKELLDVFFENNKRAYEAGGEVLTVSEPISKSEVRTFKKFYAIMDVVGVIIGMGDD